MNEQHDRDSWQPLDLSTLEERPPILPDLGDIGIVYPGKRHVFSGPQESAKTLAAYAIALEVIRRGDRVVVIDFEMGRWDARNRLLELGATDEELRHIIYLEPDKPATSDRIAALIALNPWLVIIDAAAGAYDNQGLDDNARKDVEKFTRMYVRDFWRHGIATIVIDHVVKNTEGRGNYAIGSERKVGGADVHLGFEVKVPISRGANGLYKIVTHKDRGGYLKRGHLVDLHLSSDPETHRIGWDFREPEHADDAGIFRPTKLMENVSRYLEAQPEPVSRNNVETSVKGKSVDWIRKALDALIADGFVAESTGARNARLVASGSPYRHVETPSSTTSSDLVRPRPDDVHTTSSVPVPLSEGTGRGGSVETTSTPSDELNGSVPDEQDREMIAYLESQARGLDEQPEW